MSLTPEEHEALSKALDETDWAHTGHTEDEIIWLAATAWAWERAAKVCDHETASGNYDPFCCVPLVEQLSRVLRALAQRGKV